MNQKNNCHKIISLIKRIKKILIKKHLNLQNIKIMKKNNKIQIRRMNMIVNKTLMKFLILTMKIFIIETYLKNNLLIINLMQNTSTRKKNII